MKDLTYKFLPFGVAITLLSVLIYGVNQQQIRKSANNPQIEIAENAIDLIFTGLQPYTLFASRPIDAEKRLSTFQEIYNDKGEVVGSNGRIDGQSPVIPEGVLEYAREHGENRLTWEPKPGVRLATVVMRFASTTSTSTQGFVLAARNMREIEARQKSLILEALIGWIVTLVLTFTTLWISHSRKNNRIEKSEVLDHSTSK